MKIFRFTIIEKEILSWWTEASKIEDFLFTHSDLAIQECFELTIQFKTRMDQGHNVTDESIWTLKTDITKVLCRNKLHGLKFTETDAEISFEIYDKYIEKLENCEFYRQRVRQYGNFFNLTFTDKEINRIHPAPEEDVDPNNQAFIIPMTEKQINNDR